jgi:CHRD domain
MKSPSRAALAVVFIAAVPIAAAACGGGKKVAPAKATTATTSATTTATKAASKSYKLTATLSAAQAVPKPKDATAASGSFSATITLSGKTGTLAWHLSFTHLSGPAIMAHIHLAPPGKVGPIAIPLCAPCKPNASGSFHGPIGGNVRLLHALGGGATYVNVHTKLNPQGEIRGQIKATASSGASTTGGQTTTGGTTTSSGY